MGADDLGSAVRGQAELVLEEGDAVCREDPVGDLQVKEPVVHVGRDRAGAVEEEALLAPLAEDLVLEPVLVVRHAQDGDVGKVEALDLLGVLTLGVLPQDDPLPLKTLLEAFPHAGHGSSASSVGLGELSLDAPDLMSSSVRTNRDVARRV